jgi:LPS sulfotransferase NodH
MDIDNYMKFFARTISDKNTKMVGFKCVCHWIVEHGTEMKDISGWIKRNKPHIIHVERHNKAKQIISQRLAQARKKSHLLRGQHARQVPVVVDPAHLKKKINQTIALNQKIVDRYATGYPYMKIMYEDFYSNTYKVTSRLCDFLGVPPMEDLPLPTKKISPVDLSTVIINYEDVKGLL